MILRRLGNKTQLAAKIVPYFPEHSIYIEPCFGAGGMFFNKPKVKYNFLNDIDNDIFNLFMVVKNNREELYRQIELLPVHQSLMRFWKKNQEQDPIWKAIRFLFVSNFTYLSKGYSLKFTADNPKAILLRNIEPTFLRLSEAKLMNEDFFSVLKNISFHDKSKLCTKASSFIYADWPYLGTDGNYKHGTWNEETINSALDMLAGSGIRDPLGRFRIQLSFHFRASKEPEIEHRRYRRAPEPEEPQARNTHHQL